MNTFVFTCGDINGIGPEIIIKTIGSIRGTKGCRFIIISPLNIFETAYRSVNASFPYTVVRDNHKSSDDEVVIMNSGTSRQKIGEPTKESGLVSYNAIRKSFELVNNKRADAIITAPISKFAFSLAGIDFPGHTELYAELAGIKKYVMTFVSPKMKCALLTIHEPIKKIPALIKAKRLKDTIEVLVETLRIDFRIEIPSIAVLGLNPHAGENGRIGTEEEDILKPAIFSSEYSRYLSGPYVPDAFFGQNLYKKFDLVLGMYHDQVLIPFKMLDFSKGVNYTAGLPFVRTSPDHGTAFNIAGNNEADPGSMIEAFKLAYKIVNNRNKITLRKED